MAIIKPRRGLSTALAGSDIKNDYELKYTTDTNDFYIYRAGDINANVNITSKAPVVAVSSALSKDTIHIIMDTNKFRFLNIYASLSTRYDHYFRLPKALYPSPGSSITYLITFEHGSTVKYATVTVSWYNSTSLTIKHDTDLSLITFKVVKEY